MKEIFTSETFQMLSDRIDTFMEEHDVYDYDNVTIIIEKVADEADPSGYTWKATLMPKDAQNALEDLLVEEYGIVRHFWQKEDIRGRMKELCIEINEEVVDEVAISLGSKVDSSIGLNWDVIDYWIEEFTMNAEMTEDDDEEE